MLASGKLAVEFQPKYHNRTHLKQILRTAFPHDFNFEEFEEIEPQDDPNGSVWFSAYDIDDPDKFGNYKEWTFNYTQEDWDMDTVIVVPVDEITFEEFSTEEEITKFLKKYG